MKNANTDIIRNELKQKVDSAVAAIQQAAEKDDRDGLIGGLRDLISADIEQKAEEIAQRLAKEQAEAQELADEQVLAQRGIRQLTSREKDFYQKFVECVRAKDPQQALTNANLVLPETVIDRVFEDLRTEHPLLSRINFLPTGAAIKFILNRNGYQKAAWGELCDEIVKELTSGFEVVNTNLFKLSAFLPVCKQALDLGPAWLDRYVREVLYEAFANGMEAGVIDGTGKDMPIGMTRQVGAGVTVTDGVYPRKEAVAVTSFDATTQGNLVFLVAVGPNGTARRVRDLILVCNPADEPKVLASTKILAGDGTYRNATLYPMEVITSPEIGIGNAVFGLGYRYAAFIGSDTDGNIEYSDHYRFLEDQRVYLIKGFANGMPMDNNAFLYLDISALRPLLPRVETVSPVEASSDATLASLTLGSASLSPAFASATDTYTAATTNNSNTINATPSDASANIEITLNGTSVANGSALTWETGENTVVVIVTAADGTTTKTYTVTVTKS